MTASASLLVLNPHGAVVAQESSDALGAVALRRDAITIGRDPDNDVVLAPDPDQLVSRRHCVVEQDGRHWRIRDLDSTNHVFVDRGDEPARVGDAELLDGDQVCLRADSDAADGRDRRYWRLVFNDGGQTRRAGAEGWLQYYAASKTVWLLGGLPRCVKPRAKVMRVLVHMLERHRAAGEPADGMPFSHDELKAVAWPDDPNPALRTTQALRGLMSELRDELGQGDAILRSEIGEGYRLVPRP